jgi:hypothetical protein
VSQKLYTEDEWNRRLKLFQKGQRNLTVSSVEQNKAVFAKDTYEGKRVCMSCFKTGHTLLLCEDVSRWRTQTNESHPEDDRTREALDYAQSGYWATAY